MSKAKFISFRSCSADTGFSSLCSSTKSERQKAAADLLKRLDEVIGNGPLDKASLREKVNNCLVNLCGGCIGKGRIHNLENAIDLQIFFMSFVNQIQTEGDVSNT